MENLYQVDFPGCEEFIFQNAAILHFGDARKPWSHYMGYLSVLYGNIYKLSPYADKALVLEGDPLVESESIRADLERRITDLDRQIADRDRHIAEQEQLIADREQHIAALEQHIEDTQKSMSFRIGRFLTWLPRKLRGGVRCLRENGFSYTFRRFFAHLTRKA